MKLATVVIEQDGQDGQVQVTVLGEDGEPVRFDYSGEVYTSVISSSRGNLSVYVTVTPSKQEVVVHNARQSLFNG